MYVVNVARVSCVYLMSARNDDFIFTNFSARSNFSDVFFVCLALELNLPSSRHVRQAMRIVPSSSSFNV